MTIYLIHFIFLLQEEVAVQHAKMLQDVPVSCRPQDMSAHIVLFRAIFSPFQFDTDDCAEHYKHSFVDPIFKVNPGKVCRGLDQSSHKSFLMAIV